MTLPSLSPKRLAAIKSGKVKMRGTFTIDVKAIRERQSEVSKKVVDVLFGREKAPQNAQDARRKAKAKADKWFSEWIRLRDSDENGIATCITSGRRIPWRQGDCGHYLSRAKEATRYDERNCHFQSKIHNQFQGGHFMEHGFRIEEKYGRGTCHALAQKAMLPCRRTTSDYQFLADTYKARVELIKRTEPDRYNATLTR